MVARLLSSDIRICSTRVHTSGLQFTPMNYINARLHLGFVWVMRTVYNSIDVCGRTELSPILMQDILILLKKVRLKYTGFLCFDRQDFDSKSFPHKIVLISALSLAPTLKMRVSSSTPLYLLYFRL